MTDQSYWPRVTAQRAELTKQFPGGSVHIAAVANGRVCEASVENAARCIVDGTHKVADATAVAEFEKQQALLRAQSTQGSGGLNAARQLFAALGGKK